MTSPFLYLGQYSTTMCYCEMTPVPKYNPLDTVISFSEVLCKTAHLEGDALTVMQAVANISYKFVTKQNAFQTRFCVVCLTLHKP